MAERGPVDKVMAVLNQEVVEFDPSDSTLRPMSAELAATKISKKQKTFADALLANPMMPVSVAARQAGYAEAAVYAEGSQLRRHPKVQRYMAACIREGLGCGVEELKLEVIKRLYAIATADPRDVVSVKTVNEVTENKRGETKIRPVTIIAVKDSAEWNDAVATAISEVTPGRVKFHDRLPALLALARITKLASEQTRHTTVNLRQGTMMPDGSQKVSEVKVSYVEGSSDEPEGVVE